MSKCALVVCPVYEPYAGGGGQYFPLLRKKLLPELDFSNVDIITETHPSRRFVEEDAYGRVYRILPRRDTLAKKNKIGNLIRFTIGYIIKAVFLLFWVLQNEDSSVIITRYYRKGFFKFLDKVKRLNKIKLYADLRATALDVRIYEGIEVFDKIMCNSKAVYDQICSNPIVSRKAIHVVNPINFPIVNESVRKIFSELKQQNRIGRNYFLFVGQLLERKSIIEVLLACKEYNKIYPPRQLVVIGRNMLGDKIMELIEDTNSIYLGELSRDLVTHFMVECELVLQPSKLEGIPRVSLEAMYLNKKVLLPACVPEFIESDKENVCFDYSPSEMANQINRILNNQSKLNYDVLKHDPEVVLNQYEKFYE